jgi:hypothetical protein
MHSPVNDDLKYSFRRRMRYSVAGICLCVDHEEMRCIEGAGSTHVHTVTPAANVSHGDRRPNTVGEQKANTNLSRFKGIGPSV